MSGLPTPLQGLANLQLTVAQIRTILSQAYAAASVNPQTGVAMAAYDGPGSAIGPVFTAIAQLLGLDLQQQLVYMASVARLVSSSGNDVDTFVNAFGITRIPAVAASGQVTFTTSSLVPSGSQLVIPIGFLVQRADGTQYQTIVDTSNAGYSASANGYVIAGGSSTVSPTVQCLTAGQIGNCAAGAINVIYSGYGSPGTASLSTVSNASAFTNGQAQETDAQLKARFTLAMSTGVVATRNAIAAAITGVQPGLTYTIGDQLDQNNAAKAAYFTVFVNVLGQTTSPSSALLNSVLTACNNARSLGVSCQVLGPTFVTVNLVATLKLQNPLPAGLTASIIVANAQQAWSAYINNIGLDPNGNSTLAELSETFVVLRTLQGVTNVTSVTLNGGSSDITATYGQQLIAGSMTINTA